MRFAASVRTSDHSAPIELGGAFEPLTHALALDPHRTDHHKVGPKQILIAQLFEREVNQADFPLSGTKRGHGDEPERRHEGTLRDDFHHFPKAPKRGKKARPDHENFDRRSEWRERSNLF